MNCLLYLLAFAVLIFLFTFYCRDLSEDFYIPMMAAAADQAAGGEAGAYPPSMISAGDFHIQQPGAIADQGSFTSDMQSYLSGAGEGPI